MRIFTVSLLLLATTFFLLPAQAFVNEAASRGVHATYGSAAFGGGVSAYDFSGDGWDDITVATGEGQPILFFENTTQGAFQQVSFPGITDTFQTKQLMWLDFSRNGWPDLFVSSSRGENVLYLNNGSYNFTKVIFPKSLIYQDTTIASYGATAVDLDNDQHLDLYITHYDNRPGVPNQLFMGNPTPGIYTDVTASQVFNTYNQRTFCASITDYNRDWQPDIYSAEDRLTPNRLYEGDGLGGLTEVSGASGTDVVVNAMGIAVGDYDMDLNLDLYISNTPEGNPMLRNNGNGTFTRVDSLINVSYNRVGWGVNFLDYDNDMDPDLYVSGSTDIDRIQSQLFINDGAGMFQPCSGDSLPGDSTFSFSNAIGDFDNNGYPDIVVNNKGPDSLALWMNQRSGNNWLKIRLVGTYTCNQDGIGATVEVYAGGKKMVRYAGSSAGFVSQNSSTLFFGLGQATQVDSIWVRWPRNADNFSTGMVGINQFFTIAEGSTLLGNKEADRQKPEVWPQPGQDEIQVRLPAGWMPDGNTPASIHLIDLQGREVHTQALREGQKETRIAIDAYPAGMYLLRVDGSATPLLEKVMIAR